MIHPTAVIAEGAKIGKNVTIGPFTVIDKNVEISDNCKIGPRVYISGHTKIGAGTKIHAGANIGDEPQDISFKEDMLSYTEIGENCTIREYVTIHRGSKEGYATKIGNNVMLMAFVHVAHDCQLADNVIIVNNSQLAGHVEIGKGAIVSANTAIHQFCRVGRLSMTAGNCRITQDVPPFAMTANATVKGPNAVGLKRNGLGPQDRTAVKNSLRTYFKSQLTSSDALTKIEESWGDNEFAAELVDFIKASKRGLING